MPKGKVARPVLLYKEANICMGPYVPGKRHTSNVNGTTQYHTSTFVGTDWELNLVIGMTEYKRIFQF